jgi:hypothetical protein
MTGATAHRGPGGGDVRADGNAESGHARPDGIGVPGGRRRMPDRDGDVAVSNDEAHKRSTSTGAT